jgi:hypothetical protein
MGGKVDRRTVDLSGYPDLVVIYLGMRVSLEPGPHWADADGQTKLGVVAMLADVALAASVRTEIAGVGDRRVLEMVSTHARRKA